MENIKIKPLEWNSDMSGAIATKTARGNAFVFCNGESLFQAHVFDFYVEDFSTQQEAIACVERVHKEAILSFIETQEDEQRTA